MSILGRRIVVGISIVAFAIALLILAVGRPTTIGFTYSPLYAQYLGLQPVEDFERIISELPFDFVRLPVYWDRYEPLNNLWDTAELKALLDTAEHHEVGVILAIGQKVPRWPECFTPTWAKGLSKTEYAEEFIGFTKYIVENFGDHPALVRWQIENESYFPFGDCVAQEPELIREQIKIVNESRSAKPIQTTVSGEQGVGFVKTAFADVIGFSLYRSVSVPVIGEYTFPHTSFFYRVQKWLVAVTGKYAVISELQAEPWELSEFDITKPEGVRAAYEAFTEEDLKKQLRFATRTGMNEISLWGVEWWLALAHRGEGRLWEGARTLLQEL